MCVVWRGLISFIFKLLLIQRSVSILFFSSFFLNIFLKTKKMNEEENANKISFNYVSAEHAIFYIIFKNEFI